MARNPNSRPPRDSGFRGWLRGDPIAFFLLLCGLSFATFASIVSFIYFREPVPLAIAIGSLIATLGLFYLRN